MGKLNLSNFERIMPKGDGSFRFKILESGKVKISEKFMKKLRSRYLEILISKDGVQMVIKDTGKEDFKVCTNGYINRQEIAEQVVAKGAILPATYSMMWDEKEEYWIGEVMNVSIPKKQANK